MKSLIDIRQPVFSDVNHLMDIDIKCFDEPWSVDRWRAVCGDRLKYKLVGTYFSNPVGFVVWERLDNSINVIRLGVKNIYRCSGIGTKLLRAVEESAYHLKIYRVTFLVPESLCCPGDSMDVSRWLLKRGARALSIVENTSVQTGKDEDAFLFSLNVKG